MNCLVSLTFSLFLATAAYAEPAAEPRPARLPDLMQVRPQNGVDPKVAADFWNKWRLVTVRFRQDNGEQRFIYANELAWETIKEGRTSYPDGAMLGKVAFAMRKDEAFPNSLEPRRYTRVQLMLKDRRKYPDTNGWGYALYVPETIQKPEDDASMQAACHACHRLVPQRDYVFSHPAFLASEAWDDPVAQSYLKKFRPRAAADLPPFSRQVLASFQVKTPTVSYYSMHVFTGSLEESIGPLGAAAADHGQPYLLADEHGRRFLLAVPEASTPTCEKAVAVYLNEYRNNVKTLPLLKRGKSCGGRVTFSPMAPLPTELR